MSRGARHSTQLSSRLTHLRDRAHMLSEARRYFQARGVLEVDVPACTSLACVDANIDLMIVMDQQGNKRFLHSSPEYGMKRLLCEGIGDIYQISHVFRDSEISHKHNPEFTMVEWYRCGFSLEQMIADTASFIELFIGQLPCTVLTYRAAMQMYAGVDYHTADNTALKKCLEKHGISLSDALSESDKDDLLNLIMGTIVETHLGKNQLTAITDYPATQCALADIEISQGIPVAKRFEIYYEGHELANGYLELRDPLEQKARLDRSNRERSKKEKNHLPVDSHFLKALENGLPECCGVAVGFDRLMMLRNNCQHIREILPFVWPDA